MRILILSWAVLVLATACQDSASISEADPLARPGEVKASIDRVLNDWHQAAADADFEGYFGYFAHDSAIFMGTDASERWTVAEFKPWAKPYFDRGQAWAFRPEHRVVYLSDDATTAWFDEELATPNLGPSRGSGVLRLSPQGWRIVHYNLSVPIPNEIVAEVVSQVDSVLHTKKATSE